MNVAAVIGLAGLVSMTIAEAPSEPTAVADVRLNEVLADPAPGPEGDANQDGTRDAADDEFIEIINIGTASVDIAGWALRDSTRVRHVFPDSVVLVLGPGQMATVFGGGTPTGFEAIVNVASSGGLSLNNGGELVALLDREGANVDVHVYGSEGGRDHSLVRLPDGTGPWFEAGEGGSVAPQSPQRLNEGTAAGSRTTWGDLKSSLGAPPGAASRGTP